MPDDQQPVLWQVFNNFKTSNRADKNIFKFRIFIEKNVWYNFLIKNFDFHENKIIEIYKYWFDSFLETMSKYECYSPLTFNDFKKKNLFNLLVAIRNYKRSNWTAVPYTEKYYHAAKQCFIKKYSKFGGNPIDGFKFINIVENLGRGKKIEDVISKKIYFVRN